MHLHDGRHLFELIQLNGIPHSVMSNPRTMFALVYRIHSNCFVNNLRELKPFAKDRLLKLDLAPSLNNRTRIHESIKTSCDVEFKLFNGNTLFAKAQIPLKHGN